MSHIYAAADPMLMTENEASVPICSLYVLPQLETPHEAHTLNIIWKQNSCAWVLLISAYLSHTSYAVFFAVGSLLILCS